jgi:hypothetical protein
VDRVKEYIVKERETHTQREGLKDGTRMACFDTRDIHTVEG